MRAGIIVLVFGWSLWLCGVAVADIEYDVHQLASDPAWRVTAPNVLNEHDEVAGFRSDPGFRNAHGLHWTDPFASPVDVESAYGVPSGRNESQVNGLNNRGLLVGLTYATDPSDAGIAILWNSNTASFVDLSARVPTRAFGRAFAINDHGDAVGQVYTGLGLGIPQDAYFWSADGLGDRFLSPRTGDDSASATDVNQNGWAVGSSFSSSTFSARAVAWEPAGTVVDLHAALVAANPEVVSSRAAAVTEDNVVAGSVFAVGTSGPYRVGWIWTAADGFTFLSAGADVTVNSAEGRFVTGPHGNPFAFAHVAAVWGDDLSLVLLPRLPGLGNHFPTSVNSRGTVVGGAAFPGNFFQQQGGVGFIAFRVPEPAGGLLVALGAGAALLLRRRRRC